MSEAAVEREVREYARRRMGGTGPRAQELISRATRAYMVALKALARFGKTSPRFWDAVEVRLYWRAKPACGKLFQALLSDPLDAILNDFPGDPDYYFGPRQFEELVLPALQGIGPNPHRHYGQQLSVVGDFVVHTHCEELSLDQQRAGTIELIRILNLLGSGSRDPMVPQLRYCTVTDVCKLLFMRTARNSPPETEFDRPFDRQLAAEAARGGVLKQALRLLGDARTLPGILGVPNPMIGPFMRDENEIHILCMCQLMVGALISTGDLASTAKVGRWAAGQPQVVSALVDKLKRQPEQILMPSIMNALRLVAQLCSVSPPLLEAFKARGLRPAMEDLLRTMRDPVDIHEVRTWIRRIFEEPVVLPAVFVENPDLPSSQQPQAQLSREEASALPVRELKARLQAAGVDYSGCTEKQELVHLLLACERTGAGSQGNGAAGQGPGPAADGAPAEVKSCACCGAVKGPEVKLSLCSGCRQVRFCSTACQRQMWPEHKAACKAAQQQQQEQAVDQAG